MKSKILPCKCGADARKRYKDPYVWIECRKKCGMHTGFYSRNDKFCTKEAEDDAVKAWNRMVKDAQT